MESLLVLDDLYIWSWGLLSRPSLSQTAGTSEKMSLRGQITIWSYCCVFYIYFSKLIIHLSIETLRKDRTMPKHYYYPQLFEILNRTSFKVLHVPQGIFWLSKDCFIECYGGSRTQYQKSLIVLLGRTSPLQLASVQPTHRITRLACPMTPFFDQGEELCWKVYLIGRFNFNTCRKVQRHCHCHGNEREKRIGYDMTYRMLKGNVVSSGNWNSC